MRIWPFTETRQREDDGPEFEIECEIWSEPGRGHANEDVVAAMVHPQNPKYWIAALADGQGGQAGGTEAARIAVGEVMRKAAEFSVDDLQSLRTWEKIGDAADIVVMKDPHAGYCTLVDVIFGPDGAAGVSSGDSAAYGYTDKARELTRNQRKNPSVGSGGAYFAGFVVNKSPGHQVLLMSDGVWKYADPAEIGAARIEPGKDVIARLKASVLERFGNLPDDFSVISLRAVEKDEP